MEKVAVNTTSEKYTVFIERGVNTALGTHLQKIPCGDYVVVVTNKKIYSLFKTDLIKSFSKIKHKFVFVPDGEQAKSSKWLFRVIENIIEQDSIKRNIFIACLGGGVVGDLGAFAASIYKRGIPVVQIPTTFLAQIDSSVGGKTAIDFKRIKNIVGSFYQPMAVFIDPLYLKTLSWLQMKQGIAEAIKYGVIADSTIFTDLEHNKDRVFNKDVDFLESIIARCIKIKARVVTEDERETKGIRAILNFGHTAGHALESVANYRISHGEAVAWGMMVAADISHALGYCDRGVMVRIKAIVKDYGFSSQLRNVSADKLIKFLMRDKKFKNKKIRMVLAKNIGEVKVSEGIDLEDIRESLQNVGMQ